VLAASIIIGGYLLGDGLRRARMADRAVTVRGLAERDVTANLATWTINFNARAPSSATVQAESDRDARTVLNFFRTAGFRAEDVTDAGGSVNQYFDNDRGENSVTVNRRCSCAPTTSGGRAGLCPPVRADPRRRRDPGRLGHAICLHALNRIKPEMIAQATRDARAAPSVRQRFGHRRRRYTLGDPGLFLDRRARRRRASEEGFGGQRFALPEGPRRDDDRILSRLRLRLGRGCGGGRPPEQARVPAVHLDLAHVSQDWPRRPSGVGVGARLRRRGGRAARLPPCCRRARRACRRAGRCPDCRGQLHGPAMSVRARVRLFSRRASAADMIPGERIGRHSCSARSRSARAADALPIAA
jgi:hypothetical protein